MFINQIPMDFSDQPDEISTSGVEITIDELVEAGKKVYTKYLNALELVADLELVAPSMVKEMWVAIYNSYSATHVIAAIRHDECEVSE